MNALIQRIRLEGTPLGHGNVGIVKLDSLINHQLDPQLTLEMGQAFKARLEAAGVSGVTRVLTVEVSGIAAALTTALAYGVPMVYARKTRPITLSPDPYTAGAVSRTKGNEVTLSVSRDFLSSSDRVIIIDDFLASGKTLMAMVDIVRQSGAVLLGLGGIVEKTYDGGRALLEPLGIPIVSLACIESADETGIVVSSGRG